MQKNSRTRPVRAPKRMKMEIQIGARFSPEGAGSEVGSAVALAPALVTVTYLNVVVAEIAMLGTTS